MKKTAVNNKNTILLGAAVLFVILMLLTEIFRESITDAFLYGEWIYGMISRFCGGGACILLICAFLPAGMLKFKVSISALAVFLPCMLIAVNNFPFIPFFSKEAYVIVDAAKIALYALFCISVGFFEEMAFRGCIFSYVLQRKGNKAIDVFWSIVISSAIFAVVHIVNIFMGADPGATLLQIGYSFLIGGMCSVILVKTHNIWFCVILHAVYNFAGGIIPNCGGGIIWTLPEIVLTAVVAVAVAAYVIYRLVGIKPSEVDALIKKGA